ncbi:MAG: RHS repeat-associated core domain-containing protein [Lysobacterales bacterium]
MQSLLPSNSPASYVPNELNQYTSVDNGKPLNYDPNGNLTAFDGWSYGYDAHNRLVSATQPAGTSLDLDYDPNGRLISTTLDSSTTDYVYSGDQLIGEYDSLGNPINLYVYAPGSDIPIARFSGSNGLNDVQYLRADERGSIVVETDGTLVLESHQYDVYGVPLEESDSLFRYTGQIQLKRTELYHYKARAYHPGLGRFLQTDPIGYDDGMNMYAYVGNDPVNAIDPSSMQGVERSKFIWSKQLSGFGTGARNDDIQTPDPYNELRDLAEIINEVIEPIESGAQSAANFVLGRRDSAASAGGEVTGTTFIGIAGTSISVGFITDSNFNVCSYTNACFQLGIGGFGGGGVNGVVGGPQPLEPGRAQSWGFFYNYGAGAANGASVNFSEGQFSAGRAFLGPGGGAVIGAHFCETNIRSCTLPSN